MKKARRLCLSGASCALGVLVVVGLGGSASASSTAGEAKPGVTKVKIEFTHKNKDLRFEAPATVPAGNQLQIKNNTNPAAIGPHTFSIVHKQDLPRGKQQQKACGKKLKGICGAIVLNWHDVNLQTNQIGENPVEVGKKGWDQAGSLKHKGDSWIALRKGAKFQREVTAPVGKTLYFICAVHPFMQGKITVVPGS